MSGRAQRTQIDGQWTEVAVVVDGLDLGDRVVSWLDVDGVDEGNHSVGLGLADGSRIELAALGATHDRFILELRTARRLARFPSLTIATGAPAETFISRVPDRPADIHLYPDVVVVEPHDGSAEPLPLALVDAVHRDGHTFVLECFGIGERRIGMLGAATDRFGDALERARVAQQVRLVAAARTMVDVPEGAVIRDGRAVRVDDGPWPAALRGRAAAGERSAELSTLEQLSGDVRFGLWTGDGTTPMLFCLAAANTKVAVESLSGEARATFVFAADDVDLLNAALVVTSFRRDVMSLPEDQLGRWAVAPRNLPIVRDLRSRLVARVEHRGDWSGTVAQALSA